MFRVPLLPGPTRAGEVIVWVRVGKRDEMGPQTARVVEAAGRLLALIATGDGLYALDNTCPHAGGSLGEGRVEGATVTCPLHGWSFDCSSGVCINEEAPPLTLYPVKVEDDEVLVQVEETEVLSPSVKAREPEVNGQAPEARKRSSTEIWKAQKHGFDVWDDLLRHARDATPMSRIDRTDLERMKWYGFFYRKQNDHNHYMCRVRIPGCELLAHQARALAFVAYESGYSLVDLTTRGNVQVQGLTVDKLPGVFAALERVGLSSRQTGHDNVRNVTSHPWSGLDPEELVDTRGLARQIQAMLLGSRELSDLPRKFNISLCGRPDAAVHGWTQDLSLVAVQAPQGLGFSLLVGGNQGSSPHLAWFLPVLVRPEQVLGVVAAALRTFRELGYRHNRSHVRFRYLVERLGPEVLLQEIEGRLGYELDPLAQVPPPPRVSEDFVGWFPQKQAGKWMAGVCVPLGRLAWDQLEGMAVVASKYGDATLRTTYDQNLVLAGIDAEDRDEVDFALARYGLSTRPDSVTRNVVACTGKQFCNLAVTETKGHAYRLMEELRRRKVQLQGIRIHTSGCPSSCAMTHTADIGLQGVRVRRKLRVVDGFDVYLGGGIDDEVCLGRLYRQGVPSDEIADLVEGLTREFYLHRAPGESFSRFSLRRLVSLRRLATRKASEEAPELPRWVCSQCGHEHVAGEPPPFCPVCSAIRSRFGPAPEAPALET